MPFFLFKVYFNRLCTVRLYITVLFLIVLLTIAFIFGSQNNQLFTLNYLIAKAEISVAAAVSLFTTIGFLLGLLTAVLFRIVKSLKSKSTNL
jgi:putative membrane protein